MSARPAVASGIPAPVPMELWKERDPAARRIPGVYAGRADLTGDPLAAVSRLAADGVQLARLDDLVDLGDPDGAATVAALCVVRELTSHGIAVDWTIRLPAAQDWRPLSHLYPPAAVASEAGDGDRIAAEWRATFHVAMCGYRAGPGFLEVRDRRTGTFKRLVLRNPGREEAIAALLRGVRATALSPAVTEHYLRAGLLHRTGRYVWWAPYRIRRWPLSETIP
ncbi:hypothetical protein SAMN05444920_114157 [Nonomuraea solani]|uniref:Uncharacterized protein n=1 Tax=Nonomuraea solani TaxID=1144553 RepID=A0A1H6ES07_9ACTN|nr:DUF5825 family protein [Nonomuraea solani]SEG99881.1 hypothetical protein SAMN05444920_114157 [Nonomuraea solani]